MKHDLHLQLLSLSDFFGHDRYTWIRIPGRTTLFVGLKTRIPRVQMRLCMQDAFTKTGLYTLVEVLIRCKQISVSVKTRLSMLEVKSTVKSKIVAHFFVWVVYSQSER